MPELTDIVVTGLGVISPIGIGRDEFWSSLEVGRSGIEALNEASEHCPLFVGAALKNFDPKLYVTPRKALKVMAPELQTAYSASRLAWLDAGLGEGQIDPDRVGVVFGSEAITGEPAELKDAVEGCMEDGQMHLERWGSTFHKNIAPLWMLKSLPNMPACHVGIAVDARGPNNTIVVGETSGLLALQEAAMIIQRGAADMMVVGTTGSLITPSRLIYRHKHMFHRATSNDEYACMPYDLRRSGIVPGEGAGAIIIESREHAARRGAKPIARLAGWSNCFARPEQPLAGSTRSIAAAVRNAMRDARILSTDLAHVAGQAYSEKSLDASEAQAIHSVVGDTPVVGFSSYFGQLGGGGGMVELIATILSMAKGLSLPTLGYAQPDPDCPVHVLTTSRANDQRRYSLKLNFTPHGQSAAVVIECLN